MSDFVAISDTCYALLENVMSRTHALNIAYHGNHLVNQIVKTSIQYLQLNRQQRKEDSQY